MGEAPAIAVVVPTYRRAHLLPRLVAALEAQQAAPPFEIVLVDNASPDATATVLTALQRKASVPLRALRVTVNRGPATARNLGWRSSQAALVAFMDDDCVPAPTWLAEVSRAARGADIVQGRTDPDPEQAAGLGPFSRTMSVSHEDGLYATCNITYRREVLDRLGGFDESFEAGGEDTDLAWRAIATGATTTFADTAVVHHDVRASNWLTQVRETTHWHSLPLAVAKHPPLRQRLHLGVFWRRTHLPAIAAVAGLTAAATMRGRQARCAAAAFALPYVATRLVSEPLPYVGPKRRVLLLPAALTIDLAEIVVLLGGSVRHRSLML